jgi:hypothetical protein
MAWSLAALALAAGYWGYGWRGLVLALTVVVFWLLLQFTRALRTLRNAAGRPIGHIDNAVMLHTKLHAGMRLAQVVALTRSLGYKLSEEPETYAWHDAAGDSVRVELQRGRVSAVALQRAPS